MLRKVSVLAVLLAVAIPITARAHFGPFPFGPCGLCRAPFASCRCPRPICGGCHLPPSGCHCGAPVAPVVPQPIIGTRLRPVTETCYRQEQVMTYQPVTRTCVRKEAHTVNVPVTVQKQITVDEGSYQMVWVPNVKTKLVNETVLQPQVQYRDVPYQVVEQVPTVQTRIVPQQTIRYVPEPVQIAPSGGCCAPGHPVPVIPGQPAPSVPAVPGVPSVPSVPAVPSVPEVPPSLTPPTVPPQSSSTSSDSQSSTLTTSPANEKWVKVPVRGSSQENDVQLQSFERVITEPKRLFSPVPSAASVWRAQSRF